MSVPGMNVAISTTRPFHAPLLANTLIAHNATVTVYSSAPRRFFRRMDAAVRMRMVPSVFQVGMHALHWRLSPNLLHLDSALYDYTAALRLGRADVFIGWATASLASGRKAKRHGARFVLDRACPHVDFQQRIVGGEAEKAGVPWTAEPRWFRDRQLAEYEEADAILAPSEYTRRTFPEHLQAKIIKAPLLGRCSFPDAVSYERNPIFTVGTVGGEPLRKGYLYLLEAWKKLALPHAKLLIRSDFEGYPRLKQLAGSMPSVELVGYVPDIADFYRKCDVFVLPSVDDGFGMALYEAMANGVPSIATRHCGSSELLTSERDSLVIEPMDSDALAQAILSLYEGEELRQEMARAGRAAIQKIMSGVGGSSYSGAIAELLETLRAGSAKRIAAAV